MLQGQAFGDGPGLVHVTGDLSPLPEERTQPPAVEISHAPPLLT